MKPIKCITYVLCLVAVLVTTSLAQINPGSERTRQHRAELQRPLGAFADWARSYAAETRHCAFDTGAPRGPGFSQTETSRFKETIALDGALALDENVLTAAPGEESSNPAEPILDLAPQRVH